MHTAPLLDSMQNARLVCTSYLPAVTHTNGAVAQLGERMTGSLKQAFGSVFLRSPECSSIHNLLTLTHKFIVSDRASLLACG